MMCARLIRHRPDSERGRFDLARRAGLRRIIAAYGRALDVVLDRQPLTLFVPSPRWRSPLCSTSSIPKGFFPAQDTGVIQAISEGPQDVSFKAMARLQGELAEVLLKDPDVASSAPSSAWTAPT